MKKSIKVWLSAFRLRTLPLAVSSIGMGSFLAAYYHSFRMDIFLLCILTTVLLQILSNLANDYGDYTNGADLVDRVGPARAVQSGAIAPRQMKAAVVVAAVLSLISGVYLLLSSPVLSSFNAFGFFLALGIVAIIASVKYTAGGNPYGYIGLGDLSVFFFFGIVGVCGSFFLQSGLFYADLLLPAASCGLFATGVLTINNIRDIDSDRKAGKRTIPARLGKRKASIYHTLLLLLGVLCSVAYTFIHYQSLWQLLFLVTIPLFLTNIVKVMTLESKALDPYLKQMALTSLLFVLTFGVGLLITLL